MKKWLKHSLRAIGFVVLIPLAYLFVSLILTYVPVPEKTHGATKNFTVYLNGNGLHSDIVLPREVMTSGLLTDLHMQPSDRFFSIGWGEEKFFLDTRALGDLNLPTVFRAAFLNSKTLIHVTRYEAFKPDWIAVPVTKTQISKLNDYILNSFALVRGKKSRLEVSGYTLDQDEFYLAVGDYMFYKTCNSWVNTALKESDMKASLWTPFEFGILRRYQN